MNDPIARLPADKLPSEFLESQSMTNARDLARRPWYYGYNDSYQANGGENTAGGGFSGLDNPQHPQQWGMGQLDDWLGFRGVVDSGAAGNWANNWQNLTPQQQMGAWSYFTLPGMGTPQGGNHWLPAVSYRSMLGNNGYHLQNDGNLAPTPAGTYSELLPQNYTPPANLQTFLNTPVSQNPVGGMVTQNAGPPTGAKSPAMAGGGYGTAGASRNGGEMIILPGLGQRTQMMRNIGRSAVAA